MFDALMRDIAALDMVDGHGDMHGVEQRLLLMSHWSSNCRSSSGLGPPTAEWTEAERTENAQRIRSKTETK